MVRWLSSYRIIQKWANVTTIAPANIAVYLKVYPKSYRKYLITGVTVSLAAIYASSKDKEAKDTNEDNDIIAGASGVFRFVRSIKIGLAISLDYYFSMVGLAEGCPNYDVMMSTIHQRCANRLLDGCLQNGGTYIKLGQGLVSLSHILPKEYIDTLKILQDKCLKRDKKELYQVFLEDLGQSPEDLFESFDVNPIAAASIAQVFKATTKEGEKVAVKVQYNDLRKRLKSDVITINMLLAIGSWLHPKVDFSWVLNDFVEALKQELDFINEGHNAEKCSKDLAHLKYVHVPTVFWKYTKTRILVTEFVEAIKINDDKRLREEGFSLADINNKLFESFGYQIFQSGFVHADPHPGNVMVRRKDGKTELIILDHGLYQTITNQERVALSHFWKAIVLNDHNEMQFYSKSLGVDDYRMFAAILTQSPLQRTGFKLKYKMTQEEREQMRKATAEHFDLVVECLQQMPRTLLLVVRNLNTIRAISYDHGCPIDRYAVLARVATRAAFASDQAKLTLSEKLVSRARRAWFEIKLTIIRLSIFWTSQFWRLLHILGIAPDVNALMERTARAL